MPSGRAGANAGTRGTFAIDFDSQFIRSSNTVWVARYGPSANGCLLTTVPGRDPEGQLAKMQAQVGTLEVAFNKLHAK